MQKQTNRRYVNKVSIIVVLQRVLSSLVRPHKNKLTYKLYDMDIVLNREDFSNIIKVSEIKSTVKGASEQESQIH